jgi:hypothetical protein
MTDGGAVFPNYERGENLPMGTREIRPIGGMTLRDYFAAKAMQVILHPANERIYDEREIAGAAYSMADEKPAPPWGDRTTQIRWAVIQQGESWFTADTIASVVPVDRDLVSNTLARFVQRGWIERARKLPMQRQQYRRIPKG